MSIVLELKQQMAAYMGRTEVDDLNPVNWPDPGVDIDLGLYGLNNARRSLERIADFRYAQMLGGLSIATVGTALTSITGLTANAKVKRVVSVRLPISGGYIPCEFLTETEYEDRLKRQVGRQTYDPSKTEAQLGVSNDNPYAYQLGQAIYLGPASQFTFPVSAQLNVIQFMPDYVNDGDADFFTQFCPEYLLWKGVLEVNKWLRRFVTKNEGNIDEASVESFASDALQTALKWNADIAGGTTTPPE